VQAIRTRRRWLAEFAEGICHAGFQFCELVQALGHTGAQKERVLGLKSLLDWVEDQPGDSWQDRWLASGADTAGRGWREVPAGWLHGRDRIFITDAITSGLLPHIARVIAGHQDLNVTMGYRAVYPDEATQAHLAFLTRRLPLPPEPCMPTDRSEHCNPITRSFQAQRSAEWPRPGVRCRCGSGRHLRPS
jgi:hypothetical protein